MNKTVKWIIIAIVVIVALAIAIWAINKFSGPSVQPPASGPGDDSDTGNIFQNIIAGLFSGEWLKNLFGGGQADPACQPANPGFDNNGFYTRKCGGVPGGGGANCDPDKPGKDMNGFSSTQCGG